jgi:hypothetical protein
VMRKVKTDAKASEYPVFPSTLRSDYAHAIGTIPPLSDPGVRPSAGINARLIEWQEFYAWLSGRFVLSAGTVYAAAVEPMLKVDIHSSRSWIVASSIYDDYMSGKDWKQRIHLQMFSVNDIEGAHEFRQSMEGVGLQGGVADSLNVLDPSAFTLDIDALEVTRYASNVHEMTLDLYDRQIKRTGAYLSASLDAALASLRSALNVRTRSPSGPISSDAMMALVEDVVKESGPLLANLDPKLHQFIENRATHRRIGFEALPTFS